MPKYKEYFKYLLLKEETASNNASINITIDDLIDTLEYKIKYNDYDGQSLLKVLEDYYYSNDETKKGYAQQYINLLNKIGNKAIELGNKLGSSSNNDVYIDIKAIKNQLLKNQTEFKFNIDDFFPFPLYISSSPSDKATIGLLIDLNGKAEYFEGNDEASIETINLVNKILNPQGKPVKIYASHNSKLVQQISQTGVLPKNLYVSPNKEHASKYMLDLTGEREIFTGIININDISQESEIDWKVINDNTKIEKFKYL